MCASDEPHLQHAFDIISIEPVKMTLFITIYGNKTSISRIQVSCSYILSMEEFAMELERVDFCFGGQQSKEYIQFSSRTMHVMDLIEYFHTSIFLVSILCLDQCY